MGKRAYRQTLEDVGVEAQNDIKGGGSTVVHPQPSGMATSLKGAASHIAQVLYRCPKPSRTLHGNFGQNVAYICFRCRF